MNRFIQQVNFVDLFSIIPVACGDVFQNEMIVDIIEDAGTFLFFNDKDELISRVTFPVSSVKYSYVKEDDYLGEGIL